MRFLEIAIDVERAVQVGERVVLGDDALDGGRQLGLTTVDMLAVVAGLSRREFYKSMTTHADHRIWQDVYHADTPVKKLAYIKLTLRDGAPVIQFKEK